MNTKRKQERPLADFFNFYISILSNAYFGASNPKETRLYIAVSYEICGIDLEKDAATNHA